MGANTARTQWKLLMAIMAFCSMFWLAVAYGGLWAARAFSPMLAESLSFRAPGAGRMPSSEVSPSRGARAVLHATLAAMDEEALFELLDDINNWDTPAQEDLVKSGRVVVVNDGTPVRVLGYHPASGPLRALDKVYTGKLVRARILEGEFTGEAIWVPMEWVEEARP